MKILKLLSLIVLIFTAVLISQSGLSSIKPQAVVTVEVRDGFDTRVDGATVRICGDSGNYSEVSVDGEAYFANVNAGDYCIDGTTSTLIGADYDITITSSGGNFPLTLTPSEVPLCDNCPALR